MPGQFPRVMKVRQSFDAPEISDVPAAVRDQLARVDLASKVKPGMRIAITAGSRGISCLPAVLATLGTELRDMGAEPFVVPAMGSHGGATAEGQIEVLADLGITEESIRMPIRSTLEVVEIGMLPTGMPMYMDRNAYEADGTILVNRIKPHSLLTDQIGSGVMKISVIGLGKQKGCSTVHTYTFNNRQLYKTIMAVSRVVIQKAPVLMGLGIIDNALVKPARIVGMRPEEIHEVEPRLFEESRKLMARLPFDDLDILIVDMMGKNVSPAGLEMVVIGRPHGSTPRIKRLICLDITPESKGNAVGLGMADFVSRRLVSKINYRYMYMNALSGFDIEEAKVPITGETDRETLQMALTTIGPIAPADARLIRVKDTVHLDELYISESLSKELATRQDLTPLGSLEPLGFDGEGSLL